MRSHLKTMVIETVVIALGGLLYGAAAAAQDYPSRAINMVIPFPPG